MNWNRRDALVAGGGILVAGWHSIVCDRSHADPVDPAVPADPAGKELKFLTTTPARNAEPVLDQLVQSWLTPTKHFYVRSHAPNPVIAPDTFQLKIEGLVRKPTSLSLAQLARHERHQVTATLTCAGNRRTEYNPEGQISGVQWGPGAIGNATWSGFSLADVLSAAEVLENAKHVWFEGLDKIERSSGVIPFGGSIPIAKAMLGGGMPGALLVDRMNGAPLLPDHGFPLRTVVPGYIGARSVKWLGRIVVSDKPSPNHYLQTAYKLVKQTDPIDWTESGPIYRYPINGAIATPVPESEVKAGPIEVRGYVLPSGRAGSTAKEILLSADEGRSWQPASVEGQRSDFCWQLWSARINVSKDTKRLLLRATDTAGDFMPMRVPWNAKGYLQNSWYKLPIRVS